MIPSGKAGAGSFCWLDLAATDASGARNFYGRLLGWSSVAQQALGGSFSCERLSGVDVASIYQLSGTHLARGVPSHWTPYIQVDDLDRTVRRVISLGGQVIIEPVLMPDVARIALILDSVGAHVGLWEPVDADDMDG